jgi:DNA-binding MarR family transcriptional regulator
VLPNIPRGVLSGKHLEPGAVARAGISVSDLAALDHLQRHGLAVRRRNPSDRRSASVELATEPAATPGRCHDLLEPPELVAFRRQVTDAAAALSGRERAALITFLIEASDHAARATAALRGSATG